MIISGLVSKVVNDCGDILKSKIRRADENRECSEQNIETRIYQVIIDAINESISSKNKKQEELYDAAESILSGFKSKKENIEAVKTGLKILESQITDDRCQDFLGTLCDEICKDENDILYKELIITQNEEISENVREGFKRSQQNQEYIREDIYKGFERSEQNNQEAQRKLDYLIEKSDNNEANFYSEIHVENRAEDYAAKWEKNVFLNNFDEEDENPRPEVKLSKIYKHTCLPHYIWKFNTKESDKLYNLLKKYVINNDGKKMLLILGQPGIGKSTLITWIIANFEEKKDDFLVYQFASDLKNINWQGNDILCEILRTIHLKKDKLKDKVLILDGFDEINTNSDRERILNRINRELAEINDLRNFSLVITCRENYVCKLRKIECDFITLQAWDDNQIRCFCEAYSRESGSYISTSKINKLLENTEVFGIPLILYMVLALDITIEKSQSLVDVYDQIFSIDRSSIYDRCINNSRYDREHRISEDKIKQAIYQISQRIAFWIFENNSEKAYISQKEYEDICCTEINEISNGNENIKRDFLIGNYFKLINHCDGVGTQELHFIHRSIYEYFVVVYFFESLHNLITKEEVAGKLGELLKKGRLSQQILKFIKYKFDKIKQYSLSDVTKETFQIMLRDGMTFHTKGKYKNVIVREANIFVNILEIVHLWNSQLGKLNYNIICYLLYNRMANLNLRNIDLRKAYLSEADLRGAKLSEADLSGADLSRADLSRADLRGAKLSEADLSRADLSGADLSGVYLSETDLSEAKLRRADLRGAKLSEADLSRADLSGADLSGVYLSETDLSEAKLRRAYLLVADLRGAKLSEAGLSEADLRGAYLRGADLSGANLSGANLRGADLLVADLRGADLSEADLSEAKLSKTIFDKKQIDILHKKYDFSQSKVFIPEINDVINYRNYCTRKIKDKIRNWNFFG